MKLWTYIGHEVLAKPYLIYEAEEAHEREITAIILNKKVVSKFLFVIFEENFLFNPSALGARDLRLRQSVAKTQHFNKISFLHVSKHKKPQKN